MSNWYAFTNKNGSTSTGRITTISNVFCLPFINNGVTYDENTLNQQYGVYGSGKNIRFMEETHLQDYVYTLAGLTYGDGYYVRRGFPCVIKTNNNITSSCFTQLETTTITGEYRITSAYITSYDIKIAWGTIPVQFSLNDVVYKYMCFTGACQWSETAERYGRTPTLNGAVGMYATIPNRLAQPSDLTYLSNSVSDNSIKEVYRNKIIDFGDTPQEVPQLFVDWLLTIASPVYPYTYTVKSPNGDTLAELTEAPPMRSIALSTTGNTVNMTLRGTDGVDYPLTWTHTVPEDKTFLGLGYAATDRRASIPTADITAVTWEGDTTVYEIYGRYVPPVSTFTIVLYSNTAEINRVDKTGYLTPRGSIYGALRDECSIVNPSIIISQLSAPTFNYVYIEPFGRYYFVTNITSVKFGLWRVDLKTDVLMTYKSGIRALTAIIARQETDYNDYLIDTEIPTEKAPTVTYQEIPNSELSTQEGSDKHSFVLTVVGN